MSFCKVILNGFLGKDPKASKSAAGNEFTYFPLAYDSTSYRNPHTCWLEVVGVGKVAKFCNSTLHKGTNVFIIGDMETEDSYKDGVRRRMYKVHVSSIRVVSFPNTAQHEGMRSEKRGEDADADTRRNSVLDDLPSMPISRDSVVVENPFPDGQEDFDSGDDDGSPVVGEASDMVGYDDTRE